jgi:ABC-2 type transport system permease protein
MGAILRRELGHLLAAPSLWGLLAVHQFLVAYMFLLALDFYSRFQLEFGRLDHLPGLTGMVAAPLFETAGLVALFVVPLFTVGLLCEERRTGNLRFLFSTPVSATGIVLGKYLALLGGLLLVMGVTLLSPLSLLLGAVLDAPHLAAAVLGYGLFLMTVGAIGLLFSALTAQPVVAGGGTYALLLFLWILDQGELAEESPVVRYLSLFEHLRTLLRGVLDSVDVAYFLLLIVGCLTLAIWRVDGERRGVL